MKHRVKRSYRGASSLIALIVFLLSALAGAAILTMATVNVGRYTHQIADQQNYLSVSSAIRLVKDELAAHTVTVTNDGTDSSLSASSNSKLLSILNPLLEQCLSIAETALSKNPTESPSTGQSITFTLTLHADDDNASKTISPVNVELTVAANGALTFIFTTAEGGYTSEMTVDMKPYVTQNVDDKYIFVFEWDAATARIKQKNV